MKSLEKFLMTTIKKSIKLKFILAILIVSLVPFLLFVFISLKEGKEKLLNNVYSNLENQISLLANLINADLNNIRKQVNLWSKFQVLDDILVDDVDKRVQIFIDNIHKNSGLKGIIFCVNKNGKVVASTEKKLLSKTFNLNYLKSNFLDLHKPKYLNKYYLKFSYPIYASFDNEKLIGYFTLLYDIDNFLKYISGTDKEFNIIFNKDKTYFISKSIDMYFIGQSVNVFNKLNNNQGFINMYGYVVAYKKIKNDILKDNWYMLFVVDGDFLFAPIYQLNKIFLIIGISGILLILGTSFHLVKKIVNPIEKLTKFVQYITLNKNYSKTIQINSNDEVEVLAEAFNQMIKEINKAFKSLEKESLERLKLFLKLTETFNRITKSEKIEDVFNIVNQQLKDFPNIKEVGFSITKVKNALNIKLETEEVNGYLYFKIENNKFSSQEERFLKSIGTFVNLWLERIELMKKATESSKAKSAFIANMSHELRTPLNSIIGFAQFFQMAEEIPEEYRELAKNIETSGRHLLELINDILDFSKAEAGKIEVNKINTNIYSVVNDTLNIVKAMADEKEIYLKAYIDENLSFKTDVRLLRQILLNLLSNAVKFTEKGEITIKVKKICDRLFMSVRDTGVGIEKENLEKLFQDFTQLENPLQKKHKGTGLGLSITKKYVELLGGKIKVYSKGIGKGSRFTFYIS